MPARSISSITCVLELAGPIVAMMRALRSNRFHLPGRLPIRQYPDDPRCVSALEGSLPVEKWCLLHVVQFLALASKVFPKVRMGDPNQRLCPLADRFAVEHGHTEFGHDVPYMVARGHHTRAVLEK